MDFIKILDNKTMKSLLIDFDEEFFNGLKIRIKDIDQYVVKLLENSENYYACENGEILGYICFYANDNVTKCAYISQLCVKKGIRNKGIGSFLMNECKKLSKNSGMNKIELEVNKNNENAISFYKRNEFIYSEKKSEYESFIMECKL